MVRAWRTVRLLWIPIGVAKNILVHQSGKILIRVLRSSTCWTVHNLHGFAIKPSALMSPSVFSAARFRNLHEIDEYITNQLKLKPIKGDAYSWVVCESHYHLFYLIHGLVELVRNQDIHIMLSFFF